MKKKSLFLILFVIASLLIGLMNTIHLKPEDIGTWKNYVGYGFIIIAVINSLSYIYKSSKGINKPKVNPTPKNNAK